MQELIETRPAFSLSLGRTEPISNAHLFPTRAQCHERTILHSQRLCDVSGDVRAFGYADRCDSKIQARTPYRQSSADINLPYRNNQRKKDSISGGIAFSRPRNPRCPRNTSVLRIIFLTIQPNGQRINFIGIHYFSSLCRNQPLTKSLLHPQKQEPFS